MKLHICFSCYLLLLARYWINKIHKIISWKKHLFAYHEHRMFIDKNYIYKKKKILIHFEIRNYYFESYFKYLHYIYTRLLQYANVLFHVVLIYKNKFYDNRNCVFVHFSTYRVAVCYEFDTCVSPLFSVVQHALPSGYKKRFW